MTHNFGHQIGITNGSPVLIARRFICRVVDTDVAVVQFAITINNCFLVGSYVRMFVFQATSFEHLLHVSQHYDVIVESLLD